MIIDFTLNKETDVAIFKLGGEKFHHDLHVLCQVVTKNHRFFKDGRWHVRYASQYKSYFETQRPWPEFVQWMNDFENQMELPMYDADGVIVDGVLMVGDPDATGTPDGWAWSEVEAVVRDGVRYDTPSPVQVPVAQPDGTPYKP